MTLWDSCENYCDGWETLWYRFAFKEYRKRTKSIQKYRYTTKQWTEFIDGIKKTATTWTDKRSNRQNVEKLHLYESFFTIVAQEIVM